MNDIKFINKQIVLFFHQQLIEEYGGHPGLRDEGLLDSALAQPQATMFEEDLHQDILEMAAAYAYHLCQNHVFIDGNKRIALVVLDTFLQLNGWEITAGERTVYSLMLELADGNINKTQLAQWLRENCKKIEP